MRWKNLPLALTVIVAVWLFLRPEWHQLFPAWPGYGSKEFIRFSAPRIALTHLILIDGTGAPSIPDATIVISNGKIQAIGSGQTISLPAGMQILDLTGHTAIPGLVGMHDHMFYAFQTGIAGEMAFSFPRLYLASGVTTIRTAGAIEPSVDLQLERQIERGWVVGPQMFVTGPYMNGDSSPEQTTKIVQRWADRGATSFKAYMGMTRAQLAAAIEAAHARHLKVAGHLCAVGFREAAALGIDSLEHGIVEDSEFDPQKAPDICPSRESMNAALAELDVDGVSVSETIRALIQHHVAVTSTLPVFETLTPFRSPSQDRILAAFQRSSRDDYLEMRARVNRDGRSSLWPVLLRKEMQFERRFADAGGMLIAGADPTGNGGNLAGFGDQREVELLVEAGFTPIQALHIATSNGATFLNQSERIGTLQAGRQADLVIVKGDPSTNIRDIENVEIVFKNGVGYDSAKLLQSIRGSVGSR